MTRELDEIGALIRWCRDNLDPPPPDLLYAAAGALLVLQRQTAALDEIVDDARRDVRLADAGARTIKIVPGKPPSQAAEIAERIATEGLPR